MRLRGLGAAASGGGKRATRRRRTGPPDARLRAGTPRRPAPADGTCLWLCACVHARAITALCVQSSCIVTSELQCTGTCARACARTSAAPRRGGPAPAPTHLRPSCASASAMDSEAARRSPSSGGSHAGCATSAAGGYAEGQRGRAGWLKAITGRRKRGWEEQSPGSQALALLAGHTRAGGGKGFSPPRRQRRRRPAAPPAARDPPSGSAWPPLAPADGKNRIFGIRVSGRSDAGKARVPGVTSAGADAWQHRRPGQQPAGPHADGMRTLAASARWRSRSSRAAALAFSFSSRSLALAFSFSSRSLALTSFFSACPLTLRAWIQPSGCRRGGAWQLVCPQ